ncbi:hypothetical protein FPOAC2_03245 [Fusarium poae]|jgi:hypothetical protein|uniref:Uncharacterized protein n=1 Tax=Fusarium poae TaxID=36050 RepID=A0A1B8B8J4_FUSPO|nr:hypothetical protein FPOAC1_003141 [Fusarium poae]KAG8677129.1 hypothetical protein FPOAC1_003141 [Fusarium poae]OBS29049.1 hypothetical protein FPOA_02985 [Fusarium poae]
MDISNSRTRIVPVHERNLSSERGSPAAEEYLNRGTKRRHATVYDAVAGKVSYDQGPGTEAEEAQYTPRHPKSIRYSTKDVPLAPDEVLFRRKDAPERYLEHDIYYSHERDLPHGGQGVLPESDLLKAIHAYTSSFYSAKNRDLQAINDRNVTDRSMDETALLAFGILLEEAGKEVLGRRGDLVFTEGADDAPEDGPEPARDTTQFVGHHDISLRGRPKRRKVADSNME